MVRKNFLYLLDKFELNCLSLSESWLYVFYFGLGSFILDIAKIVGIRKTSNDRLKEPSDFFTFPNSHCHKTCCQKNIFLLLCYKIFWIPYLWSKFKKRGNKTATSSLRNDFLYENMYLLLIRSYLYLDKSTESIAVKLNDGNLLM